MGQEEVEEKVHWNEEDSHIGSGKGTGKEEKVCQKVNSKFGLAVNSGTAALHLAMFAIDIKPGDEVIVPAYTYSATANVVIHCGATPVFVDVNADDFNMNVSALQNAIKIEWPKSPDLKENK